MIPENDLSNVPSQNASADLPYSSDERTWAAFAHGSTLLNFVTGMGGLVGAALIWATQKDKSDWVGFHALQSLVFQAIQLVFLTVVVGGCWIVGFAFSFITLGFGTFIAVPLMVLVAGLGMLVMMGGVGYSLYGAYQVYNGQEFRYTWVADWVEQYFPTLQRGEALANQRQEQSGES